MPRHKSIAAINVKVLLTVLIIGAGLVGGAFYLREYRRNAYLENQLKDAIAAREAGDYSEAAICYRRWLSQHDEDQDVLRQAAEVALKIRPLTPDAVNLATSYYRTLLRLNPNDSTLAEKCLQLHEHLAQAAEVERLANQEIERGNQSPPVILSLARAYAAREKVTDAKEKLTELCNNAKQYQPPSDTLINAFAMLAEIQLAGIDANAEDGDPEQALATMDAAVGYDPSSGFAHAQRANLVRRIARQNRETPDLAVIDADFDKALELSPDDPRVLLLAVIEHNLRGSVETGWEFIDRARALPEERIVEEYLAPTRFSLALFEAVLPIAVQNQSRERALALTEETLTKLENHSRRVTALPVAIQIYAAHKEIEKAETLFAELDAAYRGKNVPGAVERQKHTLEAMLAQAKGEWDVVVRKLEPYADSTDMTPLVRNMLLTALSETGQVDRMANILKESADQQSLRWIEVQKVAQDLITKRAYADVLEMVEPFASGDNARLDARVLAVTARLGLAGGGQNLEPLRTELDQLAELAPDRSDIAILRAVVAKRSGDPEAATEILRTASSQVADPIPVELSLVEFLSEQDRSAAQELLSKLQDTYADDYRVWFSTVGFHRAASPPDLAAAQASIERALEHITTEPHRSQLEIEQLFIRFQNTRGEERIQVLNAFKQRAKERPREIKVRDVLLSLGNLPAEEAQPLIDDLRKLQGEGGLLWRYYQARLWLDDPSAAANHPKAVEYLTYCIDRNPAWDAPVLRLGQYYKAQGQDDDAERVYRFSPSIRAKDLLYRMLLDEGRERDAYELMRETANSPAGAQVVPDWQVSLALRQERYSDALRVLEAQAELGEIEPMKYVQMAELAYIKSKDVEVALAKLDDAAQRGAPEYALAYSRAHILHIADQTDQAEAVLNTFVDTQPSARAHWLRAAFYEQIQQLDKAEADYHAAIGYATDPSGYLGLGEFYAIHDRLDEAIAIWEKGLAEYPTSELLKLGLFRAMVQRGHPDDQDRMTQLKSELTAENPDNTYLIRSLVAQIVTQVGERKISSAHDKLLPLLQKTLTSGPASLQDFGYLHTIATRLGEHQLARNIAIRGLVFNRDNNLLHVLQARSEQNLGNLDLALRITNGVLNDDSENQAALDLQVDIASLVDDDDLHQRLAEQTVSLADNHPSDPIKAMLAARALAVADDRPAAIQRLTSFCAAQSEENCGRVGLMIADLQRLDGNYPAAWEWLEQSTTPESQTEADTIRYELLAAEKRFDELYSRAAESENPDLMLLAGELLLRDAQDSARAMKLSELASQSDSDWIPALVKAATWAQETGDVALMITTHRRLHERVPDDPDAANNLAWLLASAGENLEEALTLIEMAVAKQPDNFNFHDTHGFVLAKMGRLPDARDAYLRGLRAIPPQNQQQASILAQLAGVCVEIPDRATLAPYADDMQRSLDAADNSLPPEQRQQLQRALDWIGTGQQ